MDADATVTSHGQRLAEGVCPTTCAICPPADAGRPTGPRASEAEAAVRTLIAYIGDNPDREGLLDTPKRVVARL